MHILKYEEAIVTTKKKVEDYYVCDICGSKIKQEMYKTSVRQAFSEESETYPESGRGFRETYDFCAECWDEQVVPTLKEMTRHTIPRLTDLGY